MERGPALNAVVGLLERAGLDGHTSVSRDVATAAAPGPDLQEALSAGTVIEGPGWIALERVAIAEDAIADELLGLAADARLSVVLEIADGAVRSADDPFGQVQRLGLAELAAALQAVPDDVPVVLRGDPDELAYAGPGAALRDVIDSGLVAVDDRRPAAGTALLHALPAAVRSGRLPEPDGGDRSVVVVPCEQDVEVVRRVEQLVTDSIPRVFGLQPADILVLTPLRRGAAGAAELAERLGSVAVSTVHGAVGQRAEAVVACFPGQAAGVLTRALVYSAVVTARTHVSVVTGAGPALPAAVADGSLRRRVTRLRALLEAGAAD